MPLNEIIPIHIGLDILECGGNRPVNLIDVYDAEYIYLINMTDPFKDTEEIVGELLENCKITDEQYNNHGYHAEYRIALGGKCHGQDNTEIGIYMENNKQEWFISYHGNIINADWL